VRFARGTALVETAVTLSFTLLLLFGALQMALMGYFQLQLDGATFFFAHSYASGSTNAATLNADLGPLFPNVPMTIAPIFQSPPDTSVSPNFTQWGTVTNRYGGVSLLRPQRLQAKASMNITASALGGNVNLTAGNVDSRPVVGNHDDDAQGADYNSPTVYNSVVDPLHTDDQNVPPYYITLAFMWYCSDNVPWSSCSNRQLRSLGLAEYLKNDNYNTARNGIDDSGTFYLMKCHQRYYAAISVALSFLTTRQAAKLLGQTLVSDITPIYKWDYMPIQPEPGNSPLLGQLYPLNPGQGC